MNINLYKFCLKNKDEKLPSFNHMLLVTPEIILASIFHNLR